MPGPQRNRYTTKEKADFKALGKLLKYCKSYVVAILVALFFAMVAAITSIIGPNKINDLMNVIESGIQSIDGISMPDFLKICYFLISIYIRCHSELLSTIYYGRCDTKNFQTFTK